MRIALFAPTQFAIDDVAASLRRENEGIEYLPVKLGQLPDSTLSDIEKAVLIHPGQVVSIGEQTTNVRHLIGDTLPLILCVPQLTMPDRKLLIECGASGLITPRSWSFAHVAERIIAELIFNKNVNPDSYGHIKGATRVMHKLYKDIERLAPLNDPVLILGETGTGKELVAVELHRQSKRLGKFLPINCTAFSPELFESELFGHEKGAFTNALYTRHGLLVEAGRGTVFLDEIGDLDLKSQAKLLRVMEEFKVRRVGSNKLEDIHARIVMATNRDLEEACDNKQFRQDLYMRLQGFTLQLPPLRERLADLLLLLVHFVDQWNKEYSVDLKIPEWSLDQLFRYEWRGNVRELRSAVRKSAAFADSTGYISAALLQQSFLERKTKNKHTVAFDPEIDNLRDFVKRAEAEYIRAVLTLERGNKEAAARRAELSRSQFYEKLKEMNKPTT